MIVAVRSDVQLSFSPHVQLILDIPVVKTEMVVLRLSASEELNVVTYLLLM